MEIKITITTKQILAVLQVISWILFLGLAVEAGGVICSVAYIMLTENGANNSWLGPELGRLYQADAGYFLAVTSYVCITSTFKALLFYLIVKILYEQKINMEQPFNRSLGNLISNMSYLSLGIGLFASGGVRYVKWLTKNGAALSDVAYSYLDGAHVWLFMGVILLVIGQIFKRGIEIQEEHELTV